MRPLITISVVLGLLASPGLAVIAEARIARPQETPRSPIVASDKTKIPKSWGRLVAVIPYDFELAGMKRQFAKLFFQDDQGVIRVVEFNIHSGLLDDGEQGGVIQIDRE